MGLGKTHNICHPHQTVAMDEDDFQYLEDNFDPNKLRVAQLRYILTLHGIDFSNRTLKRQLVETFNENIVPRRAELRAQYVFAEPSAANIVDSRTSRSESRNDTKSAQKSPVRSRTRSASPAKPRNTRSRTREARKKPEITEPPELKPVEPSSPPVTSTATAANTPSPRRRRLQRRTNANDEDANISENDKRVILRPESHEPMVEETSFSNDNVFQTPQRKRKHPASNEPRKRAASGKRVKAEATVEQLPPKEEPMDEENQPTDIPPANIEQVPSSSPVLGGLDEPSSGTPKQIKLSPRPHEVPRHEQPLGSQKKRAFMPSLSALRMSEEFAKQVEPPSVSATPLPETPRDTTAGLETKLSEPVDTESVDTEPVGTQQVDISSPQSSDPTLKDFDGPTEHMLTFSSILVYTFKAILVLLRFAAISGVVWGIFWYRSELGKADFCGTVQARDPPYPSLLNYPTQNPTLMQLQEFSKGAVDYVWPECVPCPEHATCWEDRRLFCDDGYKLRQSLLAQTGLLPLPPSCKKDWERERAVAVIVEKALWHLRRRAADTACNPASSTSKTEAEGYNEQELRSTVYQDKSARLSDEEFNDMWRQVVAAVSTASDVEIRFVPSSKSDDKTLTPQGRFGDHGISAGAHPGYDDPQEDEEEEVEFISHSLELIPLSCRLRLYLASWIKRHLLEFAKIFAGFAGAIIVFYAVKAVYGHRKRRQKAVNEILDALKMRRQAADSDPSQSIYVFTDTLCDRTNSSLIKAVESHPHVQVNQAEQHGEIKRVWAWQP